MHAFMDFLRWCLNHFNGDQWQGIGAIATAAAVVVALLLGGQPGREKRREQRALIQLIAASIEPEIESMIMRTTVIANQTRPANLEPNVLSAVDVLYKLRDVNLAMFERYHAQFHLFGKGCIPLVEFLEEAKGLRLLLVELNAASKLQMIQHGKEFLSGLAASNARCQIASLRALGTILPITKPKSLFSRKRWKLNPPA